jgi:hypothetical protein
MNHHTVAAISIVGSLLDVLGSLYLAYDLLGGKHGPLRLLTRAVTYSVIFGVGYGLGLGLWFGLTAGIATGVTVAIEYNRASRGTEHFPLAVEAIFSAIRAAAFGIGLLPVVGSRFAVAFTALATIGQVIGYSRGVRPALDYVAALRPRLSLRQAAAVVTRAVGYIVAALLCSVFVHHLDHPVLFAVRVGLVTGLITAIGGTFTPYIEYYADNLPERYLGAFGICLIFCGFALQSFQYWLSFLDVHLS